VKKTTRKSRRWTEISKSVPFPAVPTSASLFLQHSAPNHAGYLGADKSPTTSRALLKTCNSKDKNLKYILVIIFQYSRIKTFKVVKKKKIRHAWT